MPRGQLIINNKDAYQTWGVSMNEEALSLLMTPASAKPFIENKSRLNNGKSVIVNNARVDERQITLVFNMSASSQSQFLTRYNSFVSELQGGTVNISTSFLPNVVFRCVYISCTQFSEFMMGLAKFYVRLEEPNPANRAAT